MKTELEELEKKYQELGREIENLKNTLDRQRYGSYRYINQTGKVLNAYDIRAGVDNARFEAGNYFLTEEDAKNSTLYHILNSDYFYWFPGCPKPDHRPEVLEIYTHRETWEEFILQPQWKSDVYRWKK